LLSTLFDFLLLLFDRYVGTFCGFNSGAEYKLASDLAAPLFDSTLMVGS
jgi:hypothetical protein